MSEQLNKILENLDVNADHNTNPAEIVNMAALSDEVVFLVAQKITRP